MTETFAKVREMTLKLSKFYLKLSFQVIAYQFTIWKPIESKKFISTSKHILFTTIFLQKYAPLDVGFVLYFWWFARQVGFAVFSYVT